MVRHLVALLMAATAAAQPQHNVTSVAQLAAVPAAQAHDVVGYAGANAEYAYAAVAGELRVFDVGGAVPVRSVPATGWSTAPVRLSMFRSWLYAVQQDSGALRVFDCSVATAPVEVGSVPLPMASGCSDVVVAREAELLLVVADAPGMVVLDLSADPRYPSVRGFVAGAFERVVAQEQLACLSGRSSGISVVDLTPRSLPAVLATAALPGAEVLGMTYRPRYLAVSTRSGVTGFDLNSPTAPAVVAGFSLSARPRAGRIEDGLLHVITAAGDYQCHDWAVPGAPIQDGWFNPSGTAFETIDPDLPSGMLLALDSAGSMTVLHPDAVDHDYGPATFGSGGRAPRIDVFGSAYITAPNVRFRVHDAPPLAGGLFLLGHGQVNLNLSGVHLLVEPVTKPVAIIPIFTDATGFASRAFFVPNEARHHGRNLYAQFFVQDPLGPLGLVGTRGLTVQMHYR